MEIISVSFTFFIFMKFVQSQCYSNFSLLWIFYLYYSQRNYLLPFVVCNHVGTIVPWYSSWILDSTIPTRMMTKNNWSLATFCCGDFVMHILPCFYLAYKVVTCHGTIDISNNYVRYCGLWSLLLHLIWGCSLSPNFDISFLYIPLDFWVCNLIWMSLTLAHTSTMFFFMHLYK
jgi:hypothetical protein